MNVLTTVSNPKQRRPKLTSAHEVVCNCSKMSITHILPQAFISHWLAVLQSHPKHAYTIDHLPSICCVCLFKPVVYLSESRVCSFPSKREKELKRSWFNRHFPAVSYCLFAVRRHTWSPEYLIDKHESTFGWSRAVLMKPTSCWCCFLGVSGVVRISVSLGRRTDAASFLIISQSFLET